MSLCLGSMEKSTEGGGPTATSRLLNSLLAFIKVLWLFQPAMMERCGTDGVSKWAVSHSVLSLQQTTFKSLYIDALLRQTEAPFNKLSRLQHSDCVSKALKFKQFDCSINRPRAEVNITSSVRLLGRNVKSKAWKYWSTPNWSLIRELIHQGDITEYDTPLTASVYPFSDSIMLHLICIFAFYRDTFSGHAAVIADDTFYVLSHCAQYINALLRLLNLSAQFLFSVFFCDIHNESAPAGVHILVQTLIVWRYTVQIYWLQAGVCKWGAAAAEVLPQGKQ